MQQTSSRAQPFDPGSVLLRQVRAGLQRVYQGRLESRPDPDGVLHASFPSADAPAVRIGQHVDLSCTDGERAALGNFVAQVVSRRLESAATRYGLRVKSRPHGGEALQITRRAMDRVQVDERTAGSLRVRAAVSEAIEDRGGWLVDISLGGAQVAVPIELEALLYACDRLELSFELGDGEGGPCELEARILWRRLDGVDVRYGVQFDHGDSAEAEQTRLRIAAYVERRLASGDGAPLAD